MKAFKRKKICRAFFFCALILGISVVVNAETLLFVFSDFPPFEYMENGSAAGINKEIIEEACRRLGVTPLFKQLPWKRAVSDVKNGTADAVFSLFKNGERLRYFNYPDENINTVEMILVTNRSSGLTVNSLEDLRGKTVGVYLGSSYGEAFDKSEWIKRDAVTHNSFLVKKQASARTDVSVMDIRVAGYWSEKLGMKDQLKILPFVVATQPTYVAFSKKKDNAAGKNRANSFSDVLKQMRNEGYMDKVEGRYGF